MKHKSLEEYFKAKRSEAITDAWNQLGVRLGAYDVDPAMLASHSKLHEWLQKSARSFPPTIEVRQVAFAYDEQVFRKLLFDHIGDPVSIAGSYEERTPLFVKPTSLIEALLANSRDPDFQVTVVSEGKTGLTFSIYWESCVEFAVFEAFNFDLYAEDINS